MKFGILPMYLIFFLIGVYTARSGVPSAMSALGSLAGAAGVLVACVALPPLRPLVLEGRYATALSEYNHVFCAVLAILLAPYAMATVTWPTGWRDWRLRLDRDLGNLTYEVYLLHWPVILVVGAWMNTAVMRQKLFATACVLAHVLGISWAVYLLFDRPIDRWRAR